MAASAYSPAFTRSVMYTGMASISPLMAIVAPVSPRDLVKARIPPANTDAFTIGSRIFLNAWNGLAPRVMATSSYAGSTSSRAPTMFLTTSG